ncbi:MAG: hypothetical protein IT372_42570 [Polyangiaceae bacterium]|nr:hypothetical protein [Polyangiaceae bacterium]
MGEKLEETLVVNVENQTSPANDAADALQRLNDVLEELGQAPVAGIKDASKELQRLKDFGSQAGSALAAAMSGTLNRTLAAVSGVTKLSSALELAQKRAAALQKAEDEAFAEKVRKANVLPMDLTTAPKEQSGFNKLVQGAAKYLGPGAAEALSSAGARLAEASDKLGPFVPLIEAGGKVLLAGAVALTAAAAALVVAGVAIAAKLLIAGAKLSIESTTFRENTVGAMAAVLKDAAAAESLFRSTVKLAVELGLDKEETVARARSLITAGFRGEEVDIVIRAVADVRAAKGDEAGNALQKVLEKAKSKGVFDQGSLGELAEAGVQQDLVVKALAKNLGLSIDQVKAKLKAGQLEVADGVKAILDAAKEQTGGAAEKAASSVPALLNAIKIEFESLFDSVDISPLKELLATIKSLLGSGLGAELKSELSRLSGSTFKTLFGDLQSEEGKKKLEALLKTIIAGVRGAAAVVEALAPVVSGWVDSIVKPLQFIVEVKAKIDEVRAFIEGLDFSGAAVALGRSIVDGLIEGIESGASALWSKITSVVNGAFDAAAGPKGADSHSPSRKAAKLGGFISQGFVVGMQGGQRDVGDAGAALALRALRGPAGDNPVANDNAIAPRAARAGGEGAGVTIVVQVTAGPGTTREQAQASGRVAGEAAYLEWRRHMARYSRDAVREAG